MTFEVENNRIYHENESGKIDAELIFPNIDENTVSVNRTFVDEALRGQGVADRLMNELIVKIQSDGKKAKPVCSYAIKWFEKHPEYCSLIVK